MTDPAWGREGRRDLALLDAWYARAGEHPGVTIWLEEGGGDVVCVEAVWSKAERRVGNASRAMREMVALADGCGVTLVATVVPLRHGAGDREPDEDEGEYRRLCALDGAALDATALLAWYRRLGFEVVGAVDEADPREAEIERRPKGG